MSCEVVSPAFSGCNIALLVFLLILALLGIEFVFGGHVC